MRDRLRFVLDTHALWWYLTSPRRLPPAAQAVFRLGETGNATLVIPAIVVAELHFLSAKLGDPRSPARLLEQLRCVDGVELSELGRPQLERLAELSEIPEMHDRLIAAEAVAQGASVVTRDSELAASPSIETVW